MPEYDVHVYVVGRLTYRGITAESMEEAIKRVDADADYARDFQYAEYAEEVIDYLVDLVGDNDLYETRSFDSEGRAQ